MKENNQSSLYRYRKTNDIKYRVNRNPVFLALFTLIIVFTTLAGFNTAQSAQLSDVEKWRQDLKFFQTALKTIHPDPFRTLTEKTFAEAVQNVIDRLPALTELERALELMQLVAKVSVDQGRDGHLYMAVPEEAALLPLLLYVFEDGVYVVDALPPYGSLIGKRITHYGNVPTAQVLDQVSAYIPRDNDLSAKSRVVVSMVMADVLHMVGVIDDADHIELRIAQPDGAVEHTMITPVSKETYFKWPGSASVGRLPEQATPLYLRDLDQDFLLEYLEEVQLLYIRLNSITAVSGMGESISAFSDRIVNAIEMNDVEKIVIDLRSNGGGNNQTYKPFLDTVANHPLINVPGKLFTLIGRYTFSAAGNLAADLERHTQTIFVGEPTGGSPNQYGDSQRVVLPNTLYEVFIPTIYWVFSDPDDPRLAIEPELPVPLFFTDYAAGRDPALEQVLGF